MCVLFVHKPCDLVTGCVVDDLHCLYLGVTKALLHLWLDKTNSKQPFYIGNKVCCLTHYLNKIFLVL